ncbi:hypothetical protein F4553_001003 [Allocatelliglobosispora scoriae]|uniref:Uncharacterized protein n=1 Tax=Allocatelliglobosispora scoriae TaxID=643052 RepID=A0A841BH58_9ACTN|nr:hypothetical protein [Allocatelliglobosispora scoriae]
MNRVVIMNGIDWMPYGVLTTRVIHLSDRDIR